MPAVNQRAKHLVYTLGEDHAAQDFLQIGERLGLDGAAELVQLLLAAVELLLEPPLLLAAAVLPRPLDGDFPRRRPGHFEDSGALILDPSLHPPLQRFHHPCNQSVNPNWIQLGWREREKCGSYLVERGVLALRDGYNARI